MDPITTLILSAITLGIASGLKTTTEIAVKDAYEYLKNLIDTRYSQQKKLIEAIDKLKSNPENAEIQSTIEKELIKIGINKDFVIIDAANSVHLASPLFSSKSKIYRKRLALKIKQAEALENQIDLTIDDGQKIILQEKVQSLWEEIILLEKQTKLNSL